MDVRIVIIASIVYVGLLFFIAYYAERREKSGRSLVANPYIYSLSMAVFCTAWTFYGSVGRAASQGLSFLPIYLGPSILAPVWMLVLRKILVISKSQHITSIADFISSRYGKSTRLGILATIVAVFGIVPYISIQLKAIATSFSVLTSGTPELNTSGATPFYLDSSIYIALALALFTILFGSRKLDPNERHEGLVAAVAFESIIKLVAFITAGIFVTFVLFDGFSDLFGQAASRPDIARLFSFEQTRIDGWQWFWLILISMFAILFLPRQFHVMVVENTEPNHLRKASWLFPLYLLLINLFVLPIAVGGMLYFTPGTVEPDTFVLSLPLADKKHLLALFIAIGGFSAATSMVIIAVITLSIMISNNLVLPLLLRPEKIKRDTHSDMAARLTGIRRISIVVVLLLAYTFLKLVGEKYTLVSIGLISFIAIAQFAPPILIGLYWKRATKAGAFSGLLAGFMVWFVTLPLPTAVEAGLFDPSILERGLFGLEWLRPYALFGFDQVDPISHSAFWSLLTNLAIFFTISLYSLPDAREITQAGVFVDIYKYQVAGSDYDVIRRQARVMDIQLILSRFLGDERTTELMQAFEKRAGVDLSARRLAPPLLVNYAETHLAGVIGAASAKVIIGSVAKEDPISLEEMFEILEQTQEIIQYSRALEKKSAELEAITAQLQAANERLKELDQLKADFITTVTHELRTPVTSIKALSKILLDHAQLPEDKRKDFLQIIISESDRITRLINQVLDLEKIQAEPAERAMHPIHLSESVEKAFHGLQGLMAEKQIDGQLQLPAQPVMVLGDEDRLTQVVVNLISNAIKFCHPERGRIQVRLTRQGKMARLTVTDNGRGIAPKDRKTIFEKFTQINDPYYGKPTGSGLGLFISKTIVGQHQGKIGVESEEGRGTTFFVDLPLLENQP